MLTFLKMRTGCGNNFDFLYILIKSVAVAVNSQGQPKDTARNKLHQRQKMMAAKPKAFVPNFFNVIPDLE